MTEHNFEQMRRAMVEGQLRTTAVNDNRVVAAMAAVPRERFVPAGRQGLAYTDLAVPLGGGRAMPPPMVPGRLLTEARTRPAERMLIVGAATGYTAAVAARLVAEVVALEEDEALTSAAGTVVRGPLVEGWAAGAPYDVILFDGAVEQVPPVIVAQLADGGRLAAPVLANGVAHLSIGRRAGDSFGMTRFGEASCPALPGFAPPAGFRF